MSAVGFAAWLGVPLLSGIANGAAPNNAAGRVEAIITGLLIGFALFTAWRFGKQRGFVAGGVLIVVLIVEVAKRIIVATHGIGEFGAVDIIVVVAVFSGLLIGRRSVRVMGDGGQL